MKNRHWLRLLGCLRRGRCRRRKLLFVWRDRVNRLLRLKAILGREERLDWAVAVFKQRHLGRVNAAALWLRLAVLRRTESGRLFLARIKRPNGASCKSRRCLALEWHLVNAGLAGGEGGFAVGV